MGISTTSSCNCHPQNAAPVSSPKGKMKVLKKIKRRMGLVSRSNSHGGGTNNLPPLLFHSFCGDNIRISRDGTVARRVESFCKGIAFSSRPVKVNEKVCIKFLEISNNWSGVIRFGFTYNDPSSLRYCGLPKYACPDLTNKPGYWAKALAERFCSQNTILFYYVTSAGDVHFGINGEEKGVFFSGVENRGPLWALIDVYGNSTAIEFVDIRHQLNNNRRNSALNGCDAPAEDVDRIVCSMQSMCVHPGGDEAALPPLRYQPSTLRFTSMPLHRTRGRNVKLTPRRNVASRSDTEFCQGYVFTPRPIQLGERIVIQILATEQMFQGCLGLGLTSCDPANLRTSDLPDDSNFLLDRPEYWVISKDFARILNRGDEISFCVAANGEVQISRNGGTPSVVIHVDHTLRLWAFFDIYGSTQQIRVFSGLPSVIPNSNSAPRLLSPSSESALAANATNTLNSQTDLLRPQSIIPGMCRVAPADVQVQPAANGGAVLSVLLPASHANLLNQNTQPSVSVGPTHAQLPASYTAHHSHHTASVVPTVSNSNGVSSHFRGGGGGSHIPGTPIATTAQEVAPLPSGTMLSAYSHTYIEPISASSAYSTLHPIEKGGMGGAGAECTICYEHPIDSVLYMCGHMCMCYECALQQWRGKGGGHCPLCRAVIRDVIRTYKS